ncbi:MAG TPA: hypothetical protein PKW80_02190 [Bacteroidales bacterium]|nr:hypothetical protein [Bacteroidales bacterium]
MFIKKIETHITPYSDVVAWCLMPNHFHLMLYVNHVELVTCKNTNSGAVSTRTLNKSIGIILTSYTRAINNQENRTGTLFKPHTKAICLTKNDTLSPAFYSASYGTTINILNPEKEYPKICFNYIHNNPVKAGMVRHAEDWEFSSYRDLFGTRNWKITNKRKAMDLGLI